MNDLRKSEYLSRYNSLQELMDAYIHNKTDLNLFEYYELASCFWVKENIVINDNLNNELKQIFFDDGYVIGVHRTGRMTDESNKILTEGLQLSNHVDSGIANTESMLSLTNSITVHDGYYEFLKALAEGATYKRDGLNFGNAIIVKIPKLEYENIPLITKEDGNQRMLKPEYLYGYVSSHVSEDGKIVFDELVVAKDIVKNTKLKRYEELVAIINSPEYKSYMENMLNGEAILWVPEFDGIEQELEKLSKEFEDMRIEEQTSGSPKI